MKKQKDEDKIDNQDITWGQIKYLVPFVSIIVALAAGWTTLSYKIDTVIANQNEMKTEWLQLEARVGVNALNIQSNTKDIANLKERMPHN